MTAFFTTTKNKGNKEQAKIQAKQMKQKGYINVTVMSNGYINYKVPTAKKDGIYIAMLPILIN